MSDPILLPANTVMRYAVHPEYIGAIRYVEGMQDHWIPLPEVGAVITVGFLQDPASGLPMPVRVLELQYLLQMSPPTVAIVVGPAH